VETRNLFARLGRARRRRNRDEAPGGAAPGSPPGIGISIQRDGARVRVALVGELDLGTVPAVARQLEQIQAEKPETIEIDVRRLDFLDSTGLGLLFGANRRAREAGRRLVLLKGEGPIDRILELAKVEDVIDTIQEPAAN
jgi:anti-sigma B factor antagonist